MRWVKALDRNRRVTVAPYQKAGVPASVGLSLEQCEEAAWAVTQDGRRYRGAAAVNASLAVALGVRLPLSFYELPGIGWLQERVYDLVAANRYRLPGDVPYCDQHPDQCR